MMTQKIEVKGENQHPLYQWLTRKTKNGVLESEVKWNFNKFLVDENGNLMGYFASTTGPMSSNITDLIDK
jgi:glutathione peroxidase